MDDDVKQQFKILNAKIEALTMFSSGYALLTAKLLSDQLGSDAMLKLVDQFQSKSAVQGYSDPELARMISENLETLHFALKKQLKKIYQSK